MRETLAAKTLRAKQCVLRPSQLFETARLSAVGYRPENVSQLR